MEAFWSSFSSSIMQPAFIWLLFSIFILTVAGLSVFMFHLWKTYGGTESHMLVMKIIYLPVLAILIIIATLCLIAFSLL
tara:strand:+ start:735 stop:971 length:237 start_codon:yes stop_codon:yes gene_type:complete